MQEIKTDCSLGIVCSPKNGNYLINLLNSISACKSRPSNIMVFFNEYKEDLREALDYSVSFGADVFVYNKIQPLARLWNQSILMSKNEKYSLIFNEDTIINDTEFFEKIDYYHNLNPLVVKYCEAMSAFSVTKDLIKEVGWFDENYLWAWEDSDYRIRMCKKNIKPYHVNPEPVTHLRSLGQNGYQVHKNRWDFGMNFFYKKWNIKKIIEENNLPFNLDENCESSKRNLLLNGLFCDYFYDNFAKHVEQKIENESYYNI